MEPKKSGGLLNLNDPFLKALKAINYISGNSLTESDIKKQRLSMERAGKLAAALEGDIEVEPFSVSGIECEAVKPEFAHNPRYAILYAHGGGYICGGLAYARILAAKLAAATGFTTYSFAYRLAPENPYPAALEDALTMWDHLIAEGYTPDRILLAGDSAGGNLMLCLTQRLLSENRQAPAQLLLFSPWTDMSATFGSYDVNADKDPILTKDYVLGAAGAYTAGAGDLSDSRFSPLNGDFANFPPTVIMAGRNEILLDDSVILKDRIETAGGRAILDIEEAGWHVYQHMPMPLARRAMKRLSFYVSEEIYGSRGSDGE